MRTGLKFLLLSSLFAMPALQAQDLAIPGHTQTDQVQVMPRRGANMNAVIIEFGQPEERYGPVGEPPISEWVYGSFRVYFENETVLHSIAEIFKRAVFTVFLPLLNDRFQCCFSYIFNSSKTETNF